MDIIVTSYRTIVTREICLLLVFDLACAKARDDAKTKVVKTVTAVFISLSVPMHMIYGRGLRLG
jgi:hypothetical protein